MYGAQFQNRNFFSRNNNASDEQFSLALQYVSSPASRVLDALKSPVKEGLSTRGLVQKPRGGTLQLKIRVGGEAGSGSEILVGKDILGFLKNIDLGNS